MKKIPKKALIFLVDTINQNFTISFVTYIEFLGYKNLAKAVKDFITLADVIEIDKKIINNCIKT
jgi:hypothetical protein